MRWILKRRTCCLMCQTYLYRNGGRMLQRKLTHGIVMALNVVAYNRCVMSVKLCSLDFHLSGEGERHGL